MDLHYKREKIKSATTIKKFKIMLSNTNIFYIIKTRLLGKQKSYGWIAQLARAIGSYPVGRRFESASSYQTKITHQTMGFIFFKKHEFLPVQFI